MFSNFRPRHFFANQLNFHPLFERSEFDFKSIFDNFVHFDKYFEKNFQFLNMAPPSGGVSPNARSPGSSPDSPPDLSFVSANRFG